MLEVKQLVRLYGSFVAVDHVSFAIGDREIVGLLGHNGAGKTTIMKMISGYLEPDSGEIVLGGRSIAAYPELCRQRIGYLPENLPVYPELSIVDYLDYVATLKGLRGTTKAHEIRRAMRATELEARAADTIRTLSRGFRQRVGVAQALLGRPELLILDEPTNGLDPTQTEHMRELIRELASTASIVLSTHIMQEVSAVCQRALILRNGELAVDELLTELRQTAHLRLHTSLAESALREALQAVAGIAGVQPLPTPAGDPSPRYRLQLMQATQAGDDGGEIAAAVARAITEANGDLRALYAETRDLESLFRDVNSGSPAVERTPDAA